MIVLGLDVAPLRIGWAVLSDEELELGTIYFDKDEWITPGMRAEALEDALEKHRVTHIGLEAVFVGPNKLGSIRAAMALGQVESISDYLWPDAKQKILTAAQWRSLCGITGGGKAPVMEWATQRAALADVVPDSQDSADALAIAVAAHKWFADNDG